MNFHEINIRLVDALLRDEQGVTSEVYSLILMLLVNYPNIANVIVANIEQDGDRLYIPEGQTLNLLEIYRGKE